MKLALRVVIAAVVGLAELAAGAGCHHTRRTLVPDVPTTGDATARSRFQEAREKFLHDGGSGDDFKVIAADFPHDPIVPWAELYAGIAAIRSRDFAAADQQLAHVVEGAAPAELALKARMYLAFAKNYEGDAAAARKLLVGTNAAVENDAERTEWLATFAYATAAGDKPLAALAAFDELYHRVTEPERALIVARLEELVAAADPGTLRRAFDEISDRGGPSVAVVGSRLVVLTDEAGDAAGAARLREKIEPVRVAIGLSRAITASTVGAGSSGAGAAGLVGAVLPLGSPKESRLAESAVRGMAIAAGAPDGNGTVAIETRAAIDKASAAEAVDQLAQHDVIAIVGPIDGASVDAAGGRAEGRGVPLISLAATVEKRTIGRFVFHIRHSPEARARALAQRALAKGIRGFAILAPETAYGTGLTDAFVAAVEKGGGKIIAKVTYAKDTKAFADKAAKLAKDFDWEAVFVPDEADKLALIAPALAAAGVIPKPLGGKRKLPGGRPVMLLATAEGLTSAYLADAGRHTEGALLAPGFYADEADPSAKDFIVRFREAYGHQPSAIEAYAYDAAQLVAAANAGGGRAGLAATLAKGQMSGVTGAIAFDSDHRRSDLGILYTVVEETGGSYAIRVAP